MARDVTVARRYALALFMAATKKSAVEQVGTDLANVTSLSGDAADRIRLFLEAPQVSTEQKLLVIEAGLRPVVHPLVVEFYKLLLRKKRFFNLREIAEEFERLVEEHKGIVRAKVTSAVPLHDAELTALVSSLERRLTKTVRVVSHVDSALIGGVIVRVGDSIADKSVRTLLNQMRDELLAARIPS
jgi:F-type H+-transporting ATPase subunit delta